MVVFMLISQKNLEDTCQFLVMSCRRECKQDPASVLVLCGRYRLKFAGLSILLVGFREKRIVDNAIDQITVIQESHALRSV